MNYKVKTEGTIYDISSDVVDILNIIPTSMGYHILENGKGYAIKVIEKQGKFVKLEINGAIYEVSIADEKDQLVEKMGLSLVANAKVGSIKAPMPGLILEVMVKTGDEINEGDTLVILEAMKMENALKATGLGTVKSIEVKKGETVEKGQLLIEME